MLPEMSQTPTHSFRIGTGNILFCRETIVNTVDQKLKSGDVDDYYLLIAAIIYSHEQVRRQDLFFLCISTYRIYIFSVICI